MENEKVAISVEDLDKLLKLLMTAAKPEKKAALGNPGKTYSLASNDLKFDVAPAPRQQVVAWRAASELLSKGPMNEHDLFKGLREHPLASDPAFSGALDIVEVFRYYRKIDKGKLWGYVNRQGLKIS